MAWVRKANVVLEVKTDAEAERYLDMGYNITDEWGNIIKQCVPSDAGILRHFYVEHTEQIAQLKERNAELEVRVKELEKQVKSLTAKAAKSKKADS